MSICTSGVNKQPTSGQQVLHRLHTRTVVQAVVSPAVVGETNKVLVTVTVLMPAAAAMSYFHFRQQQQQQPLIFGGKIQMSLRLNLQERPEFVTVPLAAQITITGCLSRPRLPHHHPDPPPISRVVPPPIPRVVPPPIPRWAHLLLRPCPGPRS